MGIAARLRAFRVRAGKSQAEMAQRLELNEAWYADLEKHDDELASTLTLFKAMEMASILGVTLAELLGEPPVTEKRIALIDLPDRILAHASRKGISLAQFEQQIGWELQEIVDAPVRSAAGLPIRLFQALAAALGINWLAMLPDEEAA